VFVVSKFVALVGTDDRELPLSMLAALPARTHTANCKPFLNRILRLYIDIWFDNGRAKSPLMFMAFMQSQS
jgi:hypothetical protein